MNPDLTERIARARTQTWHGSHGVGRASKRVTLVVSPAERMVILAALRWESACNTYLNHKKGARASKVSVTSRRMQAAEKVRRHYTAAAWAGR